MRNAKVAVLSAAMVMGVGCAAQNLSQYPAPIDTTVKSDLKAEIAVGGPISGESSANIIMNLFAFGGDTKYADGVVYGGGAGGAVGLPDPVSKAKAAAAYNAVMSSGADVIVAPKYIVNVKDYFVFKQVNVTVTGWSGKIKSIR